MKARINNDVVEVKVIDSNYNEHASEVKILSGTFQGKCTIVENEDLIPEKPIKTKRFLVQVPDFSYRTETWKFKAWGYAETIEEAREINRKAWDGSRILDRWTKEYIH